MALFRRIETKQGLEPEPERGDPPRPRTFLEWGSPAPFAALAAGLAGAALVIDGQLKGWIVIGVAVLVYGLYRFAMWRGDDDRYNLWS